MESGKLLGGLILCAVFVFLFFMGNRKKMFKGISWKRVSDVIAVIMAYVLAVAIIYGLYILVYVGINLIVG